MSGQVFAALYIHNKNNNNNNNNNNNSQIFPAYTGCGEIRMYMTLPLHVKEHIERSFSIDPQKFFLAKINYFETFLPVQ